MQKKKKEPDTIQHILIIKPIMWELGRRLGQPVHTFQA